MNAVSGRREAPGAIPRRSWPSSDWIAVLVALALALAVRAGLLPTVSW
jgi:hypothetical protein